MNRSSSRVPSPNAAVASRRAPAIAPASSLSARTSRMPLPPPPADGLISSGKPTAGAAVTRSRSVMDGSPAPGTTGTPAAATVALARILSPIASIAAGGGPMKVRPASAQARANAAFSARNPYPGCTACAPVWRAAATIAPAFR